MNALSTHLDDPPQPNADMIAEYLAVVFGYTTGFVPVRLLAEKGMPAGKPWSAFPEVGPDLALAILDQATRADKVDRAVFVVPGTVAAPGSAKATDIIEMAVIVVDLDDGDMQAKSNHLAKHLGPATLVIASGGKTVEGQDKLHLYWRLTEAAQGENVGRICAIRAAIATKVGGDPAFASAHQPIRVPGSIHGKYGKKSLVRIIDKSSHEYDLDEFAEAVSVMPVLAPGKVTIIAGSPAPQAGRRTAELLTQVIREGGVDGTTRFTAISKVSGHWIRNLRQGHASLEEAQDAMLDYNAACIAPAWPRDRVLREFDAILRVDLRKNGPFPTWDASMDNVTQAPHLSEDAIAAQFAASGVMIWRIVPAWGIWLHWTGNVWQKDVVGAVREAIRLTCREVAAGHDKQPEARRIASDKTIAAVLRIASSDPALATRSEDWDADQMILNCAGGVIDLTTGEICSHSPANLITRLAPASPQGSCARWTTFIQEITDGNQDLAAYLQRVCGYCLTGSTREQVFFFLHGHGANGKSVFLQTLCAVLGDYATTAALDTFMASQGDRHSTDLAGLRGARLVVVTETEPGRSWAESRIKAISGGDKISARFMHRDFFEFSPAFKLMVAGNHRPHFTGVGVAMRRRMHLIPFSVTFAPDQRDNGLQDSLIAERDGILQWMLNGCANWQAFGLRPPKIVSDAAEEYFSDEDLVGQWLESQCQQGKGLSATACELFHSWRGFADAAGMPTGSQKSFAASLRERGFVSERTSTYRGWSGIALRGCKAGEE